MVGDYTRIAGAALLLVDIGLIGVVASRLWSAIGFGLLASALMALTPANFLQAQLAPQALAILPFVLLWLLAVVAFERGGGSRALVCAGIALGVGCYSARPAIVLMPVYLAMTVALAWVRGGDRAWAAVVLAFVLSILPAVVWLALHPDVYVRHVNRYGIYDASRLTPLQGAKDFLNYNNVQERISIYWDYFDPVYLFVSGSAPTPNAAPFRPGVFPLALAAFIPAGVYQLLKRRTPMDLVLIGGLLTSPAAAAMANERYIVHRELVVIPFAILVALAGVDFLFRHRMRIWRMVAVASLVAIPLEIILAAFPARG